ncbi:hypothetical protein OF83DRAFT_1177156 [Amylostereum chailletii]|nr:hypothetical protein OF83DRAFT_1177156 [Amylostereum chailletii]
MSKRIRAPSIGLADLGRNAKRGRGFSGSGREILINTIPSMEGESSVPSAMIRTAQEVAERAILPSSGLSGGMTVTAALPRTLVQASNSEARYAAVSQVLAAWVKKAGNEGNTHHKIHTPFLDRALARLGYMTENLNSSGPSTVGTPPTLMLDAIMAQVDKLDASGRTDFGNNAPSEASSHEFTAQSTPHTGSSFENAGPTLRDENRSESNTMEIDAPVEQEGSHPSPPTVESQPSHPQTVPPVRPVLMAATQVLPWYRTSEDFDPGRNDTADATGS